MHVAFVHRRGFGQFAALAADLVRSGNSVSLITETVDQKIPSVRVIRHRAEPGRACPRPSLGTWRCRITMPGSDIALPKRSMR